MQCRLHELRQKRRISVAAASKILANLVYSYKGYGLSMVSVFSSALDLHYVFRDRHRLTRYDHHRAPCAPA